MVGNEPLEVAGNTVTVGLLRQCSDRVCSRWEVLSGCEQSSSVGQHTHWRIPCSCGVGCMKELGRNQGKELKDFSSFLALNPSNVTVPDPEMCRAHAEVSIQSS